MEQFSQTDLESAIAQLAMCEFFPKEVPTRAAIMVFLAKICPHKEALQWLTDTMVNRVGKWHGPSELRGVLASRFRPADGIETDCSSTVHFTPADQEMRSLEAHYDRKLLESPRTGLIDVFGMLPGEVLPDDTAQRVLLADVGLDSESIAMPRPRIKDLQEIRDFQEKIDPTQFAPDEFAPLKPKQTAAELKAAEDALADAVARKSHKLQAWAEQSNTAAMAKEAWYQQYKKIKAGTRFAE